MYRQGLIPYSSLDRYWLTPSYWDRRFKVIFPKTAETLMSHLQGLVFWTGDDKRMVFKKI